MLDEKMLMLAS